MGECERRSLNRRKGGKRGWKSKGDDGCGKKRKGK